MAGVKKSVRSRFSLSRLTFREVEKELSRFPALILPLGGCEPYGECGCLGMASACVEALATALSEKLHLLLAPVQMYGCSTAYGAFGGTAGVKPRTLTNILCETVRRWYQQGFRTIIIVDALFDNGGAVDPALRRLKNTNPDMRIIPFSLQRDERIRAFIGRHVRTKEPGRTEYGILSLAAFIDPDLVRATNKNHAAAAEVDAERYWTWRKRGADPEQYRKLFPDCSSSGTVCRFDPDFGRELFGFIFQLLVDTVAPFIKSNQK